jgi:hypothetical protein
MENIRRTLTTALRFAFAAALLFAAAPLTSVSAQSTNPGAVFVEGNCGDSILPESFGGGGCKADYDGDGNSGLDEDTDGDNIYGTIQGALEAIDHNGKVVIVTSGRFYENVYIGQATGGFPFGANVPGNVTLEGAPGVEAVIDAFAQPPSDTTGNNARSAATGITVNYTTNGAQRVVTLRNLQVRNFAIGIAADNNSRVNIDRVRVENNLFYGIRFSNNVRGAISNSHVTATGFRVSGAPAPPPPPSQGAFLGSGIFVNQTAQGHVVDTVSSHNSGYGISANTATGTPVVVVTRVSAPFNNTAPTFGPITQCTNVALCP